jgi:hypothetical protein
MVVVVVEGGKEEEEEGEGVVRCRTRRWSRPFGREEEEGEEEEEEEEEGGGKDGFKWGEWERGV